MYARMRIELKSNDDKIWAQAGMGLEGVEGDTVESFTKDFAHMVDMSFDKVLAEAVTRYSKAREAYLQSAAVELATKATDEKEKKKKVVSDVNKLKVEKPSDKEGIQGMLVPEKRIHV